MTWSASAPGKMLVCGEYAVLDGAEAVLVAVDRRAVAHADTDAPPASPFLAAAAQQIERELGANSDAAALAAHIAVDTSALAQDGRKLGLGSSAATTVAAIGCALAIDPLPIELIHRLAHAAHASAQAKRGAPGSGADIAASVHGGAIAVRRVAAGEPLAVRRVTLPAALHLVAVWTGEPADTAQLVAQVQAGRDRAGHAHSLLRIADASAAFVDACARGDLHACVHAIGAGREAITELAGVTQTALVSERHLDIVALAQRAGGEAKPTGAGGGDIVLAAFAAADSAQRFRSELAAAGIAPLDIAIDPDGVRIDR